MNEVQNALVEKLYYEVASSLEEALEEVKRTYPDGKEQFRMALHLYAAIMSHFAQVLPALTEEASKELISVTYHNLRAEKLIEPLQPVKAPNLC